MADSLVVMLKKYKQKTIVIEHICICLHAFRDKTEVKTTLERHQYYADVSYNHIH